MKHWLHAFRLRTLPSPTRSTIVGSALVVVCSCTVTTREALPVAKAAFTQQQAGADDTTSKQSDADKVHEQLNAADASGRKQGHWLTKLNGKVWKDEHYMDGIRNGLCKENFANGDVYEATYVNGTRNGLCMQYHPDSAAAMFQSLDENDTVVYMVFPWELASFIVPIKGWIARRDSVEFDVSYLTGKLMYHGYLNQTEGRNIKDAAYGEHRAYYEDGSLKAIINYDKDSMLVFNRRGEVIEKTTPRKWQGRQIR